MAIIKCPECGWNVSEHAAWCLRCGFPISKTHPLNNINYSKNLPHASEPFSMSKESGVSMSVNVGSSNTNGNIPQKNPEALGEQGAPWTIDNRKISPLATESVSTAQETSISASKDTSSPTNNNSRSLKNHTTPSRSDPVWGNGTVTHPNVGSQRRIPRKGLLIPLIIVAVLALAFLSYSYFGFDFFNSDIDDAPSRTYSTMDIYRIFVDVGLPVGDYIDFTEDNDPNALMNKPNQYIAKLSFAITSLEQFDADDPIGGSIEIFRTNSDARARKDYIDELGRGMPLLAESSEIVHDAILIRIDGGITATEAQKYFDASVGKPVTPSEPTSSNNTQSEAAHEITYAHARSWVNSIGTVWVQAIIEVTNTGSSTLFLNPGAFDLEDSDGNLVKSVTLVSVFPAVIAPGEKAYYYEETTLDIDDAIDLVILPRPSVESARVDLIRLDVTDLELSVGLFDSGITARGRVENTTDEMIDFVYIAVVLFDSEDRTLGLLFTIIMEDLNPGDRIGFEMSDFSMPNDISVDDVHRHIVYSYPNQFQF